MSYILNVAKEITNVYPKDFKYLHMEIRDEMDEDITNHFNTAFEFIGNDNLWRTVRWVQEGGQTHPDPLHVGNESKLQHGADVLDERRRDDTTLGMGLDQGSQAYRVAQPDVHEGSSPLWEVALWIEYDDVCGDEQAVPSDEWMMSDVC